MGSNIRKAVRICWVWLIFGTGAAAQVRVPRMVGDGMVLQRDMPIRVWGFASPGEKVTVKFAGESASGTTADNGKWVVVLGPKKAGGPFTMDIDGINHIWLKNILVGEVWVCAGQYNMQLPMEKVKGEYAGLIANADNIPIRQYYVPQHYDYKGPRENVSGGRWDIASSGTVGSFSALGYLFARQLYDKYHCPVGLINVCAADAPAEAWLSPAALRSYPDFAGIAGRYADSTFPEGTGPADKMATGGLFNGMIAPIDTYTVKGVLWYQGEANVSRAADYTALFSTLIGDWRRHWAQASLPFIYVQMESYGPVKEQVEESQWAEMREAQRMALTIPGTGMAVAGDLDSAGGLQPRDLQELSRRLFMSAEAIAYEKTNFIFSGPIYQSMKAHGNKMHIMFSEVNTGLIVKGGGELRGFTIANADNRFVPAKAITDGKKIIVWSDDIAHPVAVRYGWADNPFGGNLFNRDILFKDGLPAPPFEGHVKSRK